MGGKLAPSLVAVRLRDLARNIRGPARMLPTAAERIASIRGVAFPHEAWARGRAASSGCVASVADDEGGEGPDVANFLHKQLW